jgi:hypothetical protein
LLSLEEIRSGRNCKDSEVCIPVVHVAESIKGLKPRPFAPVLVSDIKGNKIGHRYN